MIDKTTQSTRRGPRRPYFLGRVVWPCWAHRFVAAFLLLGMTMPHTAYGAASPVYAWAYTGSMTTARSGAQAVTLLDGRVLVVGGESRPSGSAEIYDPNSGTWSPTGSMTTVRQNGAMTLLPDGRVLMVGGYGSSNVLSSAEIYDPSSGTWARTGDMLELRESATATLLGDGKVLVVGGIGPNGNADVELYDPGTGTFTTTGQMATPRSEQMATLLPNGRVLVAGGYVCDSGGACNATSSAELYDPQSGTWSPTGAMSLARADDSRMTLLQNGNVLVTGSGVTATEVYDPSTGIWTPGGAMTTARSYATATLLPSGQVLVAGGNMCTNGICNATPSAELYDPATNSWTATSSMNVSRSTHVAALLPNGKVLVAGGFNNSAFLASAEVYGIDTGPPTTTAVLTPTANAAGWNNVPVTVAFTLTDTSGGIAGATTYYALDNSSCAPAATGSCSIYTSPFSVTTEGRHTLTFFSVDNAGNVETQHNAPILIDRTAPNPPTAHLSPAPNAAGWNRSPVTLSFSGNGDAGAVQSGVVACTRPITVSNDTPGLSFPGTCTDAAGNTSARTSATVKVDQEAPQTQATVNAVGTGCGSYIPPVSVALTGQDNLSGLASTSYQIDGGATQTYSQPFSLTTPGPHTISFSSVDVAGNVEAPLSTTVAVADPRLTASAISGTVGQSVVLAGAGFRAGERIKVSWDHGMTTPLTTTVARANCAFAAVVRIPQAAFGAHTITAVGQTSGLAASTPLFVRPATALRRYAGAQGSLNRLTGTGFAAHEAVVAYWSPGGVPLGTATTNNLGAFSVAYTTPISPTGAYRVSAVGARSGALASSPFYLAPFISVSPASGSPGSPATVAGTGYAPNEDVTVRWDCANSTCGSSIILGTATTDAAGDFANLSVAIPMTDSIGTHVIGGTGMTSRAFALTPFVVTP